MGALADVNILVGARF